MCNICLLTRAIPGETLDLASPDRGRCFGVAYLLRTSFLDHSWLVVARGGVVFINRVADDESQRHGAKGSR
jgi:hypothetical protein